ncbi:MAG: TIGR01212 family radical SAM protein [Eubacterium sp.]|nr:TIGR01212 family radical SAM protein [Eubacterium sp.]
MNYISTNDYMKKVFGKKIYKISVNGGFTCPNRDGTKGTSGCVFCSGYGSGDFSEDAALSVTEQIERARGRVEAKMPRRSNSAEHDSGNYMAYFQAFTNTYAPTERLRALFTEAINHPDIVGISVATRPDCLPDEVIELLRELNRIKPVWIELGLQTIHKKSADYIRRGYELPVYDDAVKRLCGNVSHIITHVILGLPGETREDMLDTVRYVGALPQKIREGAALDRIGAEGKKVVQEPEFGIKLQLLHVIRGTDLEKDYLDGKFSCMSMEEYVNLIHDCIELLPENMVVHRITGDGAKKTLVAPLWSADKKKVLNALNRKLKE